MKRAAVHWLRNDLPPAQHQNILEDFGILRRKSEIIYGNNTPRCNCEHF